MSKWTLVMLFGMKVFAGILYAQFYKLPKYYAGSDTWRFYRLSIPETSWLLKNPPEFFKDLFIYGYKSPGNVFSGENSYWNDLKSNVLVKIMAVMNIFSNYSYYTNIIFFNFIFIFGLLALFRVFDSIFPGKRLLIIIGLFLLPSTLFWCSGVHKDGLLLSALGLIIYFFYNGLYHKFLKKHLICIFLSALLIFSLRNYVFFALIPALIAWWLGEKYHNTFLRFSMVYLLCTILFFVLPIFFPPINMPLYLSVKQQEFLSLEAGSQVHLPLLLPNINGFVSFFPFALDMAFLRPHLSEIKNLSYIPAATEILLLLSLLLFSLFSFRKFSTLAPVVYFFLFFSFSILILCGYTIPFSGAIVRYRSLVFPLLITPLLCIIITKNTNFIKI